MEVAQLLRNGERENRHLAYASKHLDRRRVVEILVGMGNAEGGTVVVGVRADEEEGRPTGFENVEYRDQIVIDVDGIIEERVEPCLDYRMELFMVRGQRLLAFTVPPADALWSYTPETVANPVFPVRRRTEIEYLSGRDLSYYYESLVEV